MHRDPPPPALPDTAAQQAAWINDPHWYKDAVIYEVHVRAFNDSNGDGIGDFPGLTQKLDYIQDLGVNTIWLLPFYPSPMKDDGYDIADYHNVHPQYGTREDFVEFVREAHQPRTEGHHRAGHQPYLRPASRGSRLRAGHRQGRPSATTTSGAIRTPSTRVRASSSPTPRSPTGPGIRWPKPITGTASSAISRT